MVLTAIEFLGLAFFLGMIAGAVLEQLADLFGQPVALLPGKKGLMKITILPHHQHTSHAKETTMNTQEIYAIAPDKYGWRKLQSGIFVKLGDGVKLGDDVTLGDGVKLGYGVKLGGTPLAIQGTRHLATNGEEGKIQIGCMVYTLSRPEIEVAEIRTDSGLLLATVCQGDHEHQLHLLSAYLDGSVTVLPGYVKVFVFNFERRP